ncbi:hypothetical protein [uncultured Ruminococcus sp.]|uniref:hypothetical protein n=2 Tax=uncultured Ruminococcus sp. TaxID=165186 RepID=UPI0029427F73|nr:hypothetical protein [uncultured Ruminococcus sp.]
MIEVFSAPQISREVVAKKMLKHVGIAFAALAAVMIPLFMSISKDSAANRNAVRKVTSETTELWTVIVFLVVLAAVVYLSVMGIFLSRKIRKQFSNWVYYKGTLYLVSASVPAARGNANGSQVRRIMKIQDKALAVLRDTYTLSRILDGEEKHSRIHAIPVTDVSRMEQKKNGVKVRFDRYSAVISNQTEGYKRLVELLRERLKT